LKKINIRNTYTMAEKVVNVKTQKSGVKNTASKKNTKKPVSEKKHDDAKKEKVAQKKRHFRAIYTNTADDVVCSGRYSGNKPKQAANKALTSITNEMAENGATVDGVKIKFCVIEQTRGSKHKKYYYKGSKFSLDTPVTVKITKNKGTSNEATQSIVYKRGSKVMKCSDEECQDYVDFNPKDEDLENVDSLQPENAKQNKKGGAKKVAKKTAKKAGAKKAGAKKAGAKKDAKKAGAKKNAKKGGAKKEADAKENVDEKVVETVEAVSDVKVETTTDTKEPKQSKKKSAKKADENKEVAKKEVAKKEVAKKEVAKKEVAKKEVAKKEVAKKEVAKKEVAKKEVAKKEVAEKEAVQPADATPPETTQDEKKVVKKTVKVGKNTNAKPSKKTAKSD